MGEINPLPDGIYFGLPESEYHRDRALGSSDAKALLMSPEEFWADSWMNPLREDKQSTPAQVRGKAFHARILEGEGPYAERFLITPEKADYDGLLVTVADLQKYCSAKGLCTKGNKPDIVHTIHDAGLFPPIWDVIQAEHLSELEACGAESISAEMHQQIEYAARFIETNPATRDAFRGGFPEVSIFHTVGGVRCKARIDYLKTQVACDLKTYTNKYAARPDVAIQKNAAYGRHDLQAAWYYPALIAARELIARGQVYGKSPDEAWLDAYVEGDPPELFFVYQQSGGVPIARAKRMNRKLETFRTALMECEQALRIYQTNMETFGEDTPWIQLTPVSDFDDEFFAFVGR